MKKHGQLSYHCTEVDLFSSILCADVDFINCLYNVSYKFIV